MFLRSCSVLFLVAAQSGCALSERQLLEDRLASLAPVALDDRARADLAVAVRRAEGKRDAAEGIKPGPSQRFPYRFGVVSICKDSRVAVRLHPECRAIVLPRIVCLHEDSGEPYEPDQMFLGYSGPSNDLLLTEILGDHAIGVLVGGSRDRAVRVGDEAWCVPW
jgi:hypothetical protein